MTPRRGEVWSARLDPVEGSEQGGIRPVVVVSNDDVNALLQIVSVVPVTRSRPDRRIYPSEAELRAGEASLRADSVVLCHQIRTLSRRRLGKRIGVIAPATLMSIDEAMRVHLAL